jgi:hypothetical protein
VGPKQSKILTTCTESPHSISGTGARLHLGNTSGQWWSPSCKFPETHFGPIWTNSFSLSSW